MSEERLKSLADSYGRWLDISRADIEKAQKWVDRHGNTTVLLCRLIPGIRSVSLIPAGINQMNFVAFIIYTTIGTAIWAGFLTYLGYFLKSNFTQVKAYLDPVSYFVFGGIIVLHLFRVFCFRKA